MARAGRSYANRPVIARHPITWDRTVALGVFETLSEWPPLDIATPNANILLSAFETLSEWPGLAFAYDQTLHLGAFESLSEWPVPRVVVPPQPGETITGDYQIEYNGVLIGGHGNRYQVLNESFEGWEDLPALDSGNVARPTRHGAWPGRRIAQERQVTAIIGVDAHDDWAAALRDLRQLFAVPDDEVEYPLVVSTRGERLLAYGAVEARTVPMDRFSQGWAAVAVRWICSDPRRYSLDRYGINVTLGELTLLSNAGNAATHPLVRIHGPIEDPKLSATDAGGNVRELEFTLTLADGELVEINTDAGTVIDNTGVSRMSTLSGSSVPVQDWVLQPGATEVVLTASSGGSKGVDILWRDAYL